MNNAEKYIDKCSLKLID